MSENFLALLARPDNLYVIPLLYIIGSIPFAVISCKLMNLPDPRSYGSKNPGATNVLRTGNKLAAFITLLGDALKGFIPVIVLINMPTMDIKISYLLSFFILLGHMFPVFLKFKGGKGVATSFGIIFGIDVKVGFFLLLVWVFVLVIFRTASISALFAFFSLPFLVAFFIDNNFITILAVVNSLLIFLQHLNNTTKIKSSFN